MSRVLVEYSKLQKMLTKATRNQHVECDLLHSLLHFTRELETIMADFGSEFDSQLKELVAKFDDVTQEPQGLPHIAVFRLQIR
jgi:superfamily II helicase